MFPSHDSIHSLVVSGEWNLPDNCRGGVSVCMVDKRMERADEATLGSYYTAAAKKRFQFKVVPNYGITTKDAEKNIWQVLVNIKNVKMSAGYCPLSLEFVSVRIVYKNNIKLGLREKVTSGFIGSCFLPFFPGSVAFLIASPVPLATSVKAFCSP